MTIAFRFNVNAKVGLGHYNRCNVIAAELCKQGITTLAIIDTESDITHSSHSFSSIIKLDSNKIDAEQTAKLCVSKQVVSLLVDHYHCDENYQSILIKHHVNFGQYDYQCQGTYLGKFVININPAASPSWYNNCKLNQEMIFLCGADYAITNPNLISLPNTSTGVLICFGGGDDKGAAFNLIKQINSIYNGQIHYIATSSSSSVALLKSANITNCKVHLDQTDFSIALSQCHFAIVTAGTLSYEMAMIGIPFSCGYLAHNQIKMAQSWQAAGIASNLGDLTRPLSKATLSKLCANIKVVKPRTPVLDGNAAKRITKVLIKNEYK